jgi:hypothetical protein
MEEEAGALTKTTLIGGIDLVERSGQVESMAMSSFQPNNLGSTHRIMELRLGNKIRKAENMLEYRLQSAPIAQCDYRLLPTDFVVAAIERIGSRLPERGSNAYIRRIARNVSDDNRESVIDWIRALNLRAEDWVYVFWTADREGICINLPHFIEHYDDLWYPGADDVWVCPSSEEWVLEFSHEEELTVYSVYS